MRSKSSTGKMMRAFALMAGLLLLLSGCGGGEGDSPTPGGKATFVLDLSSIPEASALAGGLGAAPQVAGAMTTLAGELMIVSNEGSRRIYPFSLLIDEAALSLQTDLTIDLDPGLYTFYLLITLTINGVSHQFASIHPVWILDGGSNQVHLTLNPLLSLVQLQSVEDLTTLTGLVFSYPPDVGTFIDPRFGISIDNSAEVIFVVANKNSADGKISIFLPFRVTPYQVTARFYDGEVITDVALDDVIPVPPATDPPTEVPVEAIKTSVTYSFTDSGDGTGAATFYFPIPKEVTDLVGGPSTSGDPLGNRLQTVVTLAGGGGVLTEEVLTLDRFVMTPDPPGFMDGGVVNLAGYTPGTVTWSLSFFDQRPGKQGQIGYCAMTMDVSVLVPPSGTFFCNLNLLNQDIVTSFPVATVSVDVSDGNPISGAVILVNGEPVGISGSLPGSTEGKLQLFLRAGAYQFQALLEGRDPSPVLPVSLLAGDVNIPVSLLIPALPPPPPVTLSPVTDLTALAGDGRVTLSWLNPADPNVTGLRVVRSLLPGPADPNDIALTAWELLAGAATFEDNTAVNGTAYYYTVFTHNNDPVYSAGVQVSATAVAPPPPPQTFDPLVLTATRTHRPRNYIDGALDVPLMEGESVTVTIPGRDALEVLAGDPNRYLLFVYFGKVKCMYVGGSHDRHLEGRLLEDVEEIFERAFRSPVCTGDHRDSPFSSHHRDGGNQEDDDDDDEHGNRLREGDRLTTFGPIRSRVITGNPHFDETTVRITIPVVDRTGP